ncbi:MAG: hypothetical protein ACREDT_06725 [Methylocella sp.]
MTGVGPKAGFNSPPSEGARGGCITPVFLHLIAGLGPNQRQRHHAAPMAEANSFAMNAVAARRPSAPGLSATTIGIRSFANS